MKTVGIVIDVSATIGMGHLYRCSVLAESLREKADVHVFILGQLSEVVTKAVTRVLENFEWSSIQLGAEIIPGSDPANHNGRVVAGLLTNDEPDAWLVDLSESSQREFAQRHAHLIERALALDWFVSDHLPAKTISLVDHDEVMAKAYAQLENDACSESRLLTGSDFAILKPKIVELAAARKRLCSNSLAKKQESTRHGVNVLVTFGGADPSACTLQAADSLAQFAGSIKSVTVVLGALAEAGQNVLSEKLAGVTHQIVLDPDDFEKRVSVADIVLCGGGGTLLEAMHLGRPCVVFAQNRAEKSHAAVYERLGACSWPDRLDEVLREKKLRRRLSTRAEELIDGHGVDRITSTLMELCK